MYFPMVLTHTPLVSTPHEPEVEGMVERHNAMVRYMDFLVGRLVETLDELDLRKRTYVIFTTDNGTTRGIDGVMQGRLIQGGKGTLGENGMRAPFYRECPWACRRKEQKQMR